MPSRVKVRRSQPGDGDALAAEHFLFGLGDPADVARESFVVLERRHCLFTPLQAFGNTIFVLHV